MAEKAGAKDTKVGEAVGSMKDPRTSPRAAVFAGVGGLLGYMVLRKGTKAEKAADDRHHVIKEEVPPRPSEPVKKVAENVPIAMNARKYDTLTGKGLGVDSSKDKKSK